MARTNMETLSLRSVSNVAARTESISLDQLRQRVRLQDSPLETIQLLKLGIGDEQPLISSECS